jgi:DNA-binding beta-propeller fold protein YncE
MKILFAFLFGAGMLQAAGVERLLYVTDRTGISVYEIDNGHKLRRKIEIPDSGSYKGISVSVPLGRLYVTSNVKDDLICIDLYTDKILWRKNLGKYPDSQAMTPDGMRMYMPYRDEDNWKVIDARDGNVLATIPVGRGKNYDDSPIGSIGPHNTWMHPAGKHVYFEVLTLPYVFMADTATNQITRKIGPFSKGIRPFAVSDDERYVYANVDALLGFEVGDIRSGKMIHRVEAKTPPERLEQVSNPPRKKPHSTPSHGVNLTPDQKEVWVVDGVYGYVYAYNVEKMPPKFVAAVPLFKEPSERPHPGWVSFSIDGKYTYPDGGVVIETKTKKIVARIPTSEKLLEIDFKDGKVVNAGHR